MLIAPIFKVDYLSKQQETQNTVNHVYSNSNQNCEPSTSSTFNIFKTALNRGTEFIKNTFRSKNANNFSDSLDSSSNASTSSAVTSKKHENEDGDDEDDDDDSERSTHMRNDSPDSIKTELMLFKPINREPKTSSSTKILRVPSVRSTSSTSTIQSPCSSPFFIPITSPRQSAFKLVSNLTDVDEKCPKSKRRRNIKLGSEQNNPPSKRQKVEHAKATKNETLHNDELMGQKTEVKRETRRMKKNQSYVGIKQASGRTQKGMKNSQVNQRDSISKKKICEPEFRRITRSMKN